MEFKENPPPEYGIDGWVEAFNRQDNTTLGIRFDAQIKATDEADLTRALKVRLKSSTVNYFMLLDRPVLIVVYHSPTDACYVKWFHAERNFELGADQKVITIDCTDARLLDEDIADALVGEAAAYQTFRAGLRTPVVVSVEVEDDREVVGFELLLALRDRGDTIQDLVVFDEARAPGKPRVLVGRRLEVDLGGVATVILEPAPDAAPQSAEDAAADVLLGLAIACSMTGHYEEAARLAELCIPTSVWSRDHDVLTHVVVAFIGCHRVEAAMRLAIASAEAGHMGVAEHLTWVGLFVRGVTDEEHAAFVRAHDAIRRAAEAVGDDNQVSTSYYSMGNAYRSRRSHLQAIHHYRLAARHNRGYLQRPYYWREVGGVLYLSGRPKLAARAYACAISLGEDTPFNRGLLGDALMMSGRYEEALAEFERAGYEDPNWEVKRYAMRRLIEHGIRHQDRGKEDAERIVASALESQPSSTDMVEACLAAIELDAMCGLAWFNLGVALKDDLSAAFEPFTMAAVVQEGDVEARWNACLASTNGDVEPDLGMAIWATAIRLNGDQLLRMASQWTRESGMDQEQRREFMAFVSTIANGVPQWDAEPVIRTSAMGPEYDELSTGGLPDNGGT